MKESKKLPQDGKYVVNEMKCDHLRHWKAGGMATITNNNVVFLAQVMFCESCGFNKVTIHSVGPAPTKATAPNITKP